MRAVLKGEPLVRKLAVVSVYAILPGSMVASLFYSPPHFPTTTTTSSSSSSSSTTPHHSPYSTTK